MLLVFVEAKYDMSLSAVHILGIKNRASTQRVYAIVDRDAISVFARQAASTLSQCQSNNSIFVAHLVDEGLLHSSIKGYLSVV